MYVCLSVCLTVCLCVWYVILQHEDKNVREDLIWRLLIETTKTSIHIYQSKFIFMCKEHTIHTHIVSVDVEHNV